MKKLSVIIASLAFIFLSLNVQAHGFQNNRFGSYIGISNSFINPSYYNSYYPSFYPSNSLIAGISYRNYNSRMGLQNRLNNGRNSTSRVYQSAYRNGYRNDYRNGRNRVNRVYGTGRYTNYGSSHINNSYRNNSCYEIYYAQFGNRVKRSLPASACRH